MVCAEPTLADHAEGGENLKETGEIRSELKDRGDEASFQLDDNASDLRQELMAANKELLAKEARVKMLRSTSCCCSPFVLFLRKTKFGLFPQVWKLD